MDIQTHSITTKAGNEISVFYNPEIDLLVIDLNHKSGRGGNEILRKTLDEKKMLSHIKVPKNLLTKLVK